jgi:hypothetical protein
MQTRHVAEWRAPVVCVVARTTSPMPPVQRREMMTAHPDLAREEAGNDTHDPCSQVDNSTKFVRWKRCSPLLLKGGLEERTNAVLGQKMVMA